MCTNILDIGIEKATGWKLIAVNKKTGKFHSVAMGFQYKEDKPIPEIKTQKRIAFFYDGILEEYHPAYSKKMIGRTAIFSRFDDIMITFANDILCYENTHEYFITIIEAEVYENMASGSYNRTHVYLGSKIRFIGEPKSHNYIRKYKEKMEARWNS